MKVALKSLKWLAFLGMLILLADIIYIGSAEFYTYITRSEAKAQIAAQELFQKICAREGLEPHSFHGPDRPNIEQDKKNNQYTFIWSRSPDETISVSVTYLPYDLPYSISEAIIEQKHGAESKP